MNMNIKQDLPPSGDRQLAHDVEGCGVLVNTHDPEHALQVASSVAVLARGRIAADGPPLEIVTAEMIEDARGVRRLLPPTRAAN